MKISVKFNKLEMIFKAILSALLQKQRNKVLKNVLIATYKKI